MSNNSSEGNLSLRSLVGDTRDAMHEMASRLGEVKALREELSSVAASLESQHSTAMTYKSGADSFRNELGKLTSAVGLGKNGLTLIAMLEQEVICRRSLEQKVDLVLNQSAKKLRYAYGAIAVLVLSLLAGSVFCGYRLYDLKNAVIEYPRGVTLSNKDVPSQTIVLPDSESKTVDKPHPKVRSR